MFHCVFGLIRFVSLKSCDQSVLWIFDYNILQLFRQDNHNKGSCIFTCQSPNSKQVSQNCTKGISTKSCENQLFPVVFLPRFSRHGIFTNIYLKHDSNLGKYTLPPAYLSNIFIHNLWLFEKHVHIYIYRENTYNLHISIIYLLKKLMGFRTSWQWDEASSARKTQPVPDGRPTYSPFSW